jgi:hypothetical protein
LTIKGEKQEEKEEKKKDYYLSERSHGLFHRSRCLTASTPTRSRPVSRTACLQTLPKIADAQKRPRRSPSRQRHRFCNSFNWMDGHRKPTSQKPPKVSHSTSLPALVHQRSRFISTIILRCGKAVGRLLDCKCPSVTKMQITRFFVRGCV